MRKYNAKEQKWKKIGESIDITGRVRLISKKKKKKRKNKIKKKKKIKKKNTIKKKRKKKNKIPKKLDQEVDSKKINKKECLECYKNKTCENMNNALNRLGRIDVSTKAEAKLIWTNQVINTCPKKCRKKLSEEKIKDSLKHLIDCLIAKDFQEILNSKLF